MSFVFGGRDGAMIYDQVWSCNLCSLFWNSGYLEPRTSWTLPCSWPTLGPWTSWKKNTSAHIGNLGEHGMAIAHETKMLPVIYHSLNKHIEPKNRPCLKENSLPTSSNPPWQNSTCCPKRLNPRSSVTQTQKEIRRLLLLNTKSAACLWCFVLLTRAHGLVLAGFPKIMNQVAWSEGKNLQHPTASWPMWLVSTQL